MKRGATAAQLAYPDNWRAAQRRKVAGRLTRIVPVQEQRIRAIAKDVVVRRESRQADKKITQDYSSVISVTRTGTVGDLLTNMVQGTGSLNNFIGSQITPTGMEFNWIIDATPNDEETASPYTSVRFMLIQDKGPRILFAVDSYMNLALTNIYPQLALKNQEYDKNWTVLYDSGPISFTTVDGSANYDGLVKTGRVFIPKNKLRKVFWSNENDGPDVEKNAIRVLVWSDSGVAPHPLFAYQCQTEFTDM